jgi:hypothetical protein
MMAERAKPICNDSIRCPPLRRMRRDLLNARPNSLEEAISHRYLRKPPPSFSIQISPLKMSRKVLALRYQA